MRIMGTELPNAVVFDIDGVLCDNHVRMAEWAKAKRELLGKPWDGFDLMTDPSHPGWVKLNNMLYSSGWFTILLTGRTEERRELTVAWLEQEGVRWNLLIMWDNGTSEFYDHKRQAIQTLKVMFNIVLAVDDDDTHISMYEQEGIPTLHAIHPQRITGAS
jgi:FMN phosphatase YigB (HAD superfamily)